MRWLGLAEIAAAAHVALGLILFAAGARQMYITLTRLCSGPDCLNELQLTPAEGGDLAQIGLSLHAYALYHAGVDLFYLIAMAIPAAIIYLRLVRRRGPQAGIGLLAAVAIFSLGTLIISEAAPAAATIGGAWRLPAELIRAIGLIGYFALCLLFPDGRFVPRWAALVLMGVVIWLMGWALVPIPALDPERAIGVSLSLSVLLTSLILQVYRYRRVATPIQRQQTKWFIFGFAFGLLGVIVWSALFVAFPPEPGPQRLLVNLIGTGVLIASPLATCLCITIALVRYRLWNIDLIINRTLVYGGLSAAIVAGYTLMVSGLSLVFHAQQQFLSALLATGTIALIFQPLRERLQKGVNRLMFGERDDPYAVLSRLGRQLQQSALPEQILPALAETICQTLKLPYVAISIQRGDGERQIVTAGGRPAPTTAEWPMHFRGELVGWLAVAPRSPGEGFDPNERRLLAAIAAQSGAVAASVRLTGALQSARERLVLAREEERRRIRRDLHDELGPTLASQTLRLDAVIDLLAERPAQAAELLGAIKARNQALVAEIRRLVYELRPPALDDLGLLGALRAAASHLGTATPVISINAVPESLPQLPAAIEVAAYRIALEALTNAVRHAGAHRCEVRLELASAGMPVLRVTVADDGQGISPAATAGVGLRSMRERAEELGGSLTVETAGDGGTLVRAWLPIAPVAEEEPQ
jgi:signal transduction histidine kinase